MSTSLVRTLGVLALLAVAPLAEARKTPKLPAEAAPAAHAHVDASIPSPTGATYVEPSATEVLAPGTKIDRLFERNMTQPYVLQRLSERSYWVQVFNYGTVFYVGDEGVLLLDPLEGVYDGITQAVASVTELPITAAVYPHHHADHIGDIARYVEAAEARGLDFQIIASTKTRDSMALAASSYPEPTELVAWPRGSLQWEDLTLELHGFEWAAHSDDHAAWRLAEEGVVHAPDLMNPDQPPFYRFGGNERFRFHEDNLRQVRDLSWTHFSGSHGNIGSRDDIDFELGFVADLKAAVGAAMGAHPFSTFVDPEATAHTEFLVAYFDTIAREATDTLRPTYGALYGFEVATPANADQVAWTLFEYR